MTILHGVRDFTTANGYIGQKPADPDIDSIKFNLNLRVLCLPYLGHFSLLILPIAVVLVADGGYGTRMRWKVQ